MRIRTTFAPRSTRDASSPRRRGGQRAQEGQPGDRRRVNCRPQWSDSGRSWARAPTFGHRAVDRLSRSHPGRKPTDPPARGAGPKSAGIPPRVTSSVPPPRPPPTGPSTTGGSWPRSGVTAVDHRSPRRIIPARQQAEDAIILIDDPPMLRIQAANRQPSAPALLGGFAMRACPRPGAQVDHLAGREARDLGPGVVPGRDLRRRPPMLGHDPRRRDGIDPGGPAGEGGEPSRAFEQLVALQALVQAQRGKWWGQSQAPSIVAHKPR